jgi:hypothetical protein
MRPSLGKQRERDEHAQLDRLLDTNKKIVTIVRIKAKLKWTNVDAFPRATTATASTIEYTQRNVSHTQMKPLATSPEPKKKLIKMQPQYIVYIWHDIGRIVLDYYIVWLLCCARLINEERRGGCVQQYEPNENSCRSPIERTHCHQNYEKLFFSLLFFFFLFFCTRKRKRGLPSLT